MAGFKDYKIHIVDAHNYRGKFVAYIEELHNVIAVIGDKDNAETILWSLFEKEIIRLQNANEKVPQPNTGKARVEFASDEKIKTLRPLVDDFWEKILGTSYSTSFVSDESYLMEWEHYLSSGKNDIIANVKSIYHIDIEPIYDKPIHEVLKAIKKKNSFK